MRRRRGRRVRRRSRAGCRSPRALSETAMALMVKSRRARSSRMRGVLDLGQRRRKVVELGARRGDVDAQLGRSSSRDDDDRGLELAVRAHAAAAGARRARARTRSPSPSTATSMSTMRSLEQQVAHGAADEVDAAIPGGHGLDVRDRAREAELARGAARRRPRRRPARRSAAACRARNRSPRVTTPITSSTRDRRLAVLRRHDGTRPSGSGPAHA